MDLRETHRRINKKKNKHRGPTSVYEHLVITDGADNSSSTSRDQVAKLIQSPKLPNYNLIVIAVGIDKKDA